VAQAHLSSRSSQGHPLENILNKITPQVSWVWSLTIIITTPLLLLDLSRLIEETMSASLR
jgi:hypothetical protein